jgi:dipeptidyl-peptidase 4
MGKYPMVLRLLALLSPLWLCAIPATTSEWQKQYEAWMKYAPPTKLEGVQWSANDEWLVYRHKNEQGVPTWYLVHSADGNLRPAFENAALQKAFQNLLNKEFNPKNWPFTRIVPLNDGQLRLENDREAWTWNGVDQLTPVKPSSRQTPQNNKNTGTPERHLDFSKVTNVSPDGHWQVTLKDGNIILESLRDKTLPHALTNDGTAEDGFTGSIHWAPDSQHFAIWREHHVATRLYTVVNSIKNTKTDIPYAKPGDPQTVRQAWVFNVASGQGYSPGAEVLPLTFETRELAWTSDSTRLRSEYIERGFTGHGVLEFDTHQKKWHVLFKEHDPKFVYTFATKFRYDLDENTTLWTSERSGYLHLYRLNLNTGATLLALTQGNWVMKQVQHIDTTEGLVYFSALGRVANENPYYQHTCKVDLQGQHLVDLTPGDAHHTAEFSPHRRYLIDTASRVDLAPSFTLRRGQDGQAIKVLATESLEPLQAAGWQAPIRFHTTDRNQKYEIWGVINRPYPFDPKQHYPVLENIYAGPQDSFVPRSFNAWVMNHREPTLHGFYVVQIDGLGTFNRGKEFHQVCWRNLKDAGFPDRIKWMQEAAKIEPSMDLSRVGIFGGSAGGQNTAHALLNFGAFYKAGAADCGCYDNRIDKLWWNEQWMGYPIGPWYAANSCATDAAKLNGKLFLSVGESDTNVDVKCTYDLRDALLAAGKKDLFELHVVPGANHGACERGDMREKRLEFFIHALHPPGSPESK